VLLAVENMLKLWFWNCIR